MADGHPMIDPDDECQDWSCSRIDGKCVGMHCGRCGGSCGSQGHYWSMCRVTGELDKHHFCCPDDCELHPASDIQTEETDRG